MAEFHDGSKASEGAGLTSTHVSWAERGQMARPDIRGTGRILLPAQDQQGEVATLWNKRYCLLHACSRSLGCMPSGDDKKALP